MSNEYVPIAVSLASAKKFGCPYCGYRSSHLLVSGGGTGVAVCGECMRQYVVLAKGVKKSYFGIGEIYPELERHPRVGIPSHGSPDKSPEGGGEFFRSRGIGMDSCSCFVCGEKESPYLNNIAAFVQCKASGERIVAMFNNKAQLDYRDYEPDRVQVKIGACGKHTSNLEKLNQLVQDGIVTKEKIAAATT